MRISLSRARGIDRRILLLGGFKALMLSSLSSRLYYLQVMQEDKYTTLSDENSMRLLPIIPMRGRIFDREGKVFAENMQRYQVVLEVRDRKAAPDVARKLATILELSDEKKQDLLKEIGETYGYRSILVGDYLTWDKVTKIEVNALDLPGVFVEVPQVRNYPLGEKAVHVVGYVGKPSSEEAEGNQLYHHPRYRIGKTGLEKEFEEKLQGKAGVKRVEVNARGAFVRQISIEEGVGGQDINLSIDGELQEFAVEQLSGKGGRKKEGGASILIDVQSGEVLAMASVPGYDPNMFVRGLSQQEWNILVNNPDAALVNKPIGMQYPPGSTFKTIVGLAGLEKGVITPEERIYCPGYLKHGNRIFHCWKEGGHGHMDMSNALSQSCNVYFYTLSQRVGVDTIADMAIRFGLGTPAGIELPGEKSGLVPTKQWKKGAFDGEDWYTGDTMSVAIGQGFVSVTPLQLAVQAARLASGRKVIPTLFKRELSEHGRIPQEFERIDVSPSQLGVIQKGMDMVMNDAHGSGSRVRIREPQYIMAGKTGTAQVHNRRYEYEPAQKRLRHHALFIGFAPVQAPRYAISVVVEHGSFGSTMAAPIARDILLKAQKKYTGDES